MAPLGAWYSVPLEVGQLSGVADGDVLLLVDEDVELGVKEAVLEMLEVLLAAIDVEVMIAVLLELVELSELVVAVLFAGTL